MGCNLSSEREKSLLAIAHMQSIFSDCSSSVNPLLLFIYSINKSCLIAEGVDQVFGFVLFVYSTVVTEFVSALI